MIVIVPSLDSSLVLEKVKGSFEETKRRYELFTEFDNVALLTQDDQDFSESLLGIVHVPCTFSKCEAIRGMFSRSSYIRWFYFFVRSFRARAKINNQFLRKIVKIINQIYSFEDVEIKFSTLSQAVQRYIQFSRARIISRLRVIM